MNKITVLSFVLMLFGASAYGQHESQLYAETKQMNQFFHRFNGEEDAKGNRLYAGKDPAHRSVALREKYFPFLFDASNSGITSSLKNEFKNTIITSSFPKFLEFKNQDWMAEVWAEFEYNGKTTNFILYLNIEQENDGSKWVITDIYHADWQHKFYQDTTQMDMPAFLHPMSHELDFMNLRKIFKAPKYVEYYADKDFQPDYLSIFLHEMKTGKLKFKTVENVKFHFFQIEGWYFEVANFNRSGYNRGWLISNLLKLPKTGRKDFENLIRHKQR